MTEIKIPFTKTKIEPKTARDGTKYCDLEINTNFLMSQIEPRLDLLNGGSPDNTLARMRFVFLNNAEPALYQDLLSKNSFELTFDLEKVNYGVGGGVGSVDDTKPEVNLYQAPTSRMLEVHFSPQFAGVIKLTTNGQTPPIPIPQPGPGTPPPPPNSSSLIQFVKKSAKNIDVGEPGAQAVEMETEPFVLNFPRYGDKTFEKVVVIDNKNQNSDKLSFLLDTTNQNIQVNFLANAKINKMEPHAFYTKDEEPNVIWRNGHEKELVIYLNDVFGFKPDQIEFKKSSQSPPQKNPPQKIPPTNDKDEEIRQLKAQIKALEEKLRQNPNSPTAQNDRNTLNNLKSKLKQKEKDNSQQPNKDQFSYLLVFGGGAIVVLLIAVVYLVGRSQRKPKNS
ncbi:MAG: hypothetical protein I3264_00135 [Candidatus Moeniiplasma glomeromycotorum]|nr:hypothetical protein [Candidatus Moeniiplasma glomeromycotorum]